MHITPNVSLSEYSTMGLGGNAAYLGEVTNRAELSEAVKWAKSKQLSILMIGGGSNIVWRDEGFNGLVLVNKILGYETYAIDDNNIYLTIGAGEDWDHVVERTVKAGLTGIEALSLIPGSTGGTPIQNVGAYGQEISSTLTTVEAYDLETDQLVNIPAADCQFSYRSSRFKTTDRGRFLITAITLSLSKGSPLPPFYPSVQTYFDKNEIAQPTPYDLREAVVYIRSRKLPDPALVRNTGSFFGNPIIPATQFEKIRQQFDPVPHWPASGGIKLSAAWLIEQAGFKDYHDAETGMATWPMQPLVLYNETAKSTADLLAFKQKIVDTVQQKFGISLIQEPELLP